MRLFIGIPLPEPIKNYIETLKEPFTNETITFVTKDLFHINLLFLGEVPHHQEIHRKLSNIHHQQFYLTLTNLGTFTPHQPRVLYVGTTNEVVSLQETIHNTLSAPKTKPFISHITLGRIKLLHNKKEFLNNLKKPINHLKFPVNEFHLIQSTLTPQGPHYKIIHTYTLV